MPKAVVDKLGITKFQPSKMFLGMTDSYIVSSFGLIHAFPVQIRNDLTPSDF